MNRRRFHSYFPAQERRAIERPEASCAAKPDVIEQLQDLARDLMHPGTPLDREMRIFTRIKAGQQLARLTQRIKPLVEASER